MDLRLSHLALKLSDYLKVTKDKGLHFFVEHQGQSKLLLSHLKMEEIYSKYKNPENGYLFLYVADTPKFGWTTANKNTHQ